jgi:NADH-quinone oxidoreductase subunit J
MSGAVEWALFLALALIAIGMAAGMLLTMSMYRAGLALMSSFLALAGLFVMLDADLLAAIQIMMNVGGMLVMILFMVMIMMDPGGEMMWDMKRKMNLPGPGALSMSMPCGKPPGEEHESRMQKAEIYICPMHPEVKQQQPGKCAKCGMDLVPAEDEPPAAVEHHGMENHAKQHSGQDMNMMSMNPRQHYQMMVDMAMSTAQLPWAIAIGGASALLLAILMIRTAWPLSDAVPTLDATTMVGKLLLSRYMIGFEGAAFLILAGMVGAVIFAKRERSAAPRKSEKEAPPSSEMYTCPMHAQMQQPGVGQCPTCGMDLVPVEKK